MKKIKAKQKRLQIILGEEISGGLDDAGLEEDGGEQRNNLPYLSEFVIIK